MSFLIFCHFSDYNHRANIPVSGYAFHLLKNGPDLLANAINVDLHAPTNNRTDRDVVADIRKPNLELPRGLLLKYDAVILGSCPTNILTIN